MTVGNLVRVLWDASDNKEIQSQRVEVSLDNGEVYNTIAILNGAARSFDWRIPSVPTPFARIKVTALDGVNLPVSAVSPASFEIVNGPPDISPPQVLLLTPNTDSVLGGGLTTTIRWKESDNVGVIERVIEMSVDNGQTYQRIITLTAPSSGEEQSYDWQVPAALSTDRAKVRITVYDGASNSAAITSVGKFQIWQMPIITGADFGTPGGKDGQLRSLRKKLPPERDGDLRQRSEAEEGQVHRQVRGGGRHLQEGHEPGQEDSQARARRQIRQHRREAQEDGADIARILLEAKAEPRPKERPGRASEKIAWLRPEAACWLISSPGLRDSASTFTHFAFRPSRAPLFAVSAWSIASRHAAISLSDFISGSSARIICKCLSVASRSSVSAFGIEELFGLRSYASSSFAITSLTARA